MRTFGVREGGHGRGLISNDPGFAGVNKKRGRDRSMGKWNEFFVAALLSSPPLLPLVSPISSPILLSFPCFLRTMLCHRISFIRFGRDQERITRGKRKNEKDQLPRWKRGKEVEGGEGKSRENENFNADDDRSFSVVGYQESREVESALTVSTSFHGFSTEPGDAVDAPAPNERKAKKEIC